MQFNHDNMTGARLAAHLVGLVPEWSGSRVQRALAAHDIRRPELDDRAVAELLGWTLVVREVFAATSVADTCAAVNRLLQQGTRTAYLSTHDGRRPHLHFTPEDDDLVGRVRSVTAGGLALFVVEAEGRRLGLCARPGCPRAFVDTSRNGTRRYCSARCGNAVAVARHRDRP
ncbi:CGNR zinc finger domain-containing protein [Microbacterium imperiale]|uniref:Zinc finger CGNR domain-containing protein n=2 Tax=Microbacterium imperiale TaxID=33884 RepID=A0A9W6M3L3_9MICO|nr:CGNR zinc finger domain-containing protein [Microbacterium imperiale]BFE41806.1 CGNR zinc finger domain-containing protein [Microbacterium imperiale]GLJ80758.1 hypothetical protein GCM10017586_24410 [Microbacterium imperiale]